MPVYEYACTDCGEQLEVRQTFTDDALTVCPTCSGRLRKVLSAVGVVFKGSGFYRNDSRAASPSDGSSGDGTPDANKSAGDGSSKDGAPGGKNGKNGGGGKASPDTSTTSTSTSSSQPAPAPSGSSGTSSTAKVAAR